MTIRRFPAVFFSCFCLLVAVGAQNSSTAAPAAAETQPQPRTEMLHESTEFRGDPMLDPGPLPQKRLTLIGGVAQKVDSIRNRIVVQPFGGGKQTQVFFDERSQIYRNGAATTVLGIHRGDRVYVDSMALEGRVFARSIRIEDASGPAEASGQLVRFNAANRTAVLRDRLTSQLVSFTISDGTRLHQRDASATAADLAPGTLLEVVFMPAQKGSVAKDVNLLAVPGRNYAFAGQITHVDMRSNLLAIENRNDGKNYEIHFSPAQANREELRVGAQVSAETAFDGGGYRADSITVTKPVADQETANDGK